MDSPILKFYQDFHVRQNGPFSQVCRTFAARSATPQPTHYIYTCKQRNERVYIYIYRYKNKYIIIYTHTYMSLWTYPIFGQNTCNIKHLFSASQNCSPIRISQTPRPWMIASSNSWSSDCTARSDSLDQDLWMDYSWKIKTGENTINGLLI